MVRLLNNKNVGKITDLICFLFGIQQHFTHIINVNHPETKPCIYAMWHRHQCCVYGLPDRHNTNIMISHSKDGDVIANSIEKLFGFKISRGSKGRRGAVQATMQLIEALKRGEYAAIMVDGPRGPAGKVKDGVIKIAKLSGAPIVPVAWYSNNFNFINLPSWDKMELPVLDVRLINLYGEPLYVSAEENEEADEQARLELEKRLHELDEKVKEEYNKVYWHGLWRRKEK